MNIPNSLSMFRIFLVPVFILLFFSGIGHAYAWAMAIFLLAGLTDIIDGHLARKYNQITMLGRVLDPLADKLMVFSALICLTITGILPLWLAMLFLAKELIQLLGSLLLFRRIRDVPASNVVGKAGTFLFYVAIAVLVLFPQINSDLKLALLVLAFGMIFAALVTYAMRGVTILRAQKPAETEETQK
ncbi:MAG: CDP-alcohol phosphatidyltransferase family protein [Clostridiaceae bacterium]|nr:CDP-alcohol phosphatidyltransferase family protein [Clostridiaceae bacterium]